LIRLLEKLKTRYFITFLLIKSYIIRKREISLSYKKLLIINCRYTCQRMGHMAETIYASKDINSAIRTQSKKGAATRIEGLSGQDSIAVGLSGETRITIIGEAGDFFGALNNGPTLLLKGNAGRFCGDTMSGGDILVEGSAKEGVGANMKGGMILIKGTAGSKTGCGMTQGAIIIDGDVGDDLGLYMIGGDIIITGDAGKNVGRSMLGGNIFVNGNIESLGENASVQKPDKNDKLRLTNYLTQQNLLGEFKFKKITCEYDIPEEELRNSFDMISKKSPSK
jgi:glutamate synthase domain-containing protein 3